MRITLSDTGLATQEASWDGERFGLIEKWNSSIVKVIMQNPAEAKAYADFIYQQLQVKPKEEVVY